MQIVKVADVSSDNTQVMVLYPPDTVYETYILAQPPVVNAGTDAVVISGQSFSLNAGFNDPGLNDGPWHYTVDWGDSSPVTTGVSELQGENRINSSHTYFLPGTYTVAMSVTDNDGATGTDTVNVEVKPFTFNVDRMVVNFTSFKPYKQDMIAANGYFYLPEEVPYDLNRDEVFIEFDGVSITMPARSFKKTGRQEKYVYKSPRGRVPQASMTLDFKRGEWDLVVRNIDAGDIDNSDGMDVRLCIGPVTGEAHIKMHIDSLYFNNSE